MLLRLFYDVSTFEIFFENYMKTERNIEQDKETFNVLKERVEGSCDYLDVNYEILKQDFEECTSYRVNPETRQLEFSYEPIDEGEQPIYRAPLSEEVELLKQENVILTDYVLDMDYRLIMIELGGM